MSHTQGSQAAHPNNGTYSTDPMSASKKKKCLEGAPSYAGPDIPPGAEADRGGSLLVLIYLGSGRAVRNGYSKLGIKKNHLKTVKKTKIILTMLTKCRRILLPCAKLSNSKLQAPFSTTHPEYCKVIRKSNTNDASVLTDMIHKCK